MDVSCSSKSLFFKAVEFIALTEGLFSLETLIEILDNVSIGMDSKGKQLLLSTSCMSLCASIFIYAAENCLHVGLAVLGRLKAEAL